MARNKIRRRNPVWTVCSQAIIAVGLFSFFTSILTLAIPVYTLQVFDRVLSSRSVDTLAALGFGVGIVLLLFAALEIVRSRILVRVGTRLDMALGPQLLSKTIAEAAADGQPRTSQSMRDLDQLRGFMTGPHLTTIMDAPWAPVFLLFIYIFHPLLGLVSTFGAIFLVAMALMMEFSAKPLLVEAKDLSDEKGHNEDRVIRHAEEIEALGMMPSVLKRWRADNHRILVMQTQASKRAGFLQSLSRLLRLILQVMIIGTGAYLVIGDAITIGHMVAASILMARALAPLEGAVGAWRNMISARASYDRLLEEFASASRERNTSLGAPPDGAISVENLIYLPPDGKRAICKGFSFQIQAGEMVGVTGPIGSGKSTLARLLIGLYRPNSGSIRIDGMEASEIDRSQLGRYIGYMPQKVDLMLGTVRDNIGRMTDAPYEKVVAAATVAGAHEMISRLPNGYDTEITEGGANLSGGQRQRIALARALFGKPRVIVLDEPQSMLDAEGYQALLLAIDTIKRSKLTAIIISHHRSLLAKADKVLALRNGTIASFGPSPFKPAPRPAVPAQGPPPQPQPQPQAPQQAPAPRAPQPAGVATAAASVTAAAAEAAAAPRVPERSNGGAPHHSAQTDEQVTLARLRETLAGIMERRTGRREPGDAGDGSHQPS
ncbi:MAG: type I secretion system permease/ATPase [Acetobacterales bacterium]